MNKLSVAGTSNSILLNKEMGYIAVSYYDKNFITILDYITKNILREIPTEYCSSSSNLLAGNEKYFVYQLKAKEIIVADSKTFNTLHTLKLSNCGAVNAITISDDNLLVTTNKAIGSLDSYQNIFLFDLKKRTSRVYSDGKYYIKKSTLSNNSIIAFNNNNQSFGYLNFGVLNDSYNNILLDNGNAEYFNMIMSEKDLYVVAVLNDNFEDIYKIYKINTDDNSFEQVGAKFNNIEIHTGYIRENDKSFLVCFDKNIKKYSLMVTNGFNSRLSNTVLGASVITESVAVNSDFFCFGADKSIYFVEV